MSTDDRANELQQRFQELRREQARRVPPFDAVVDAPGREQPAASLCVGSWLRLAAAMALFAVLGLSLILVRQGKKQPANDTQAWATLSNWRATTDELLTVSSAPWDSRVTAPSDSWIENSTQPDSTQANSKDTL